MSGEQVRKITREDIQLVQNLIERCLQLYMNQKETVDTLLHQAKIQPSFTEFVWQRLEEENHEFFRAYYTRLIVKDQITRFNELLERQAESMRMYATESVPVSNGSQIQPVAQNSTSQETEHAEPNVKLANMHPTVNGNLPHVYTNDALSVQSYAQAAMDVSAHARSIDLSPNMLLPQHANLGLMQGPNGGMINSAGYSGNYGGEGILQQARPGVGNSYVEPSVQPVIEDPWGVDTSSFGFLGKIPRNFSFSDLTADFPNTSEILEGYSGSAFLATDTNDFLDPQDRGEQENQAINELDTISEDVSFDDLCSD
ncbi:hypothetical protein H5410_054126 [Solanum commersonii]|uniref:Angiotensin-converting enzyme 2 n=1 Tax=Solanum commersonii TaxID=4109 RepID=A0A9J5X5R4_SOLCO|nr:hypothetical protein H5410_054126 [Solanum commersonii]